MLLALGSPLPDDAVVALRGESGLLGRLSVPLSWGVAVPPDDYDHWAPKPEEGADADDEVTDGRNSEAAEGKNESAEWERAARRSRASLRGAANHWRGTAFSGGRLTPEDNGQSGSNPRSLSGSESPAATHEAAAG